MQHEDGAKARAGWVAALAPALKVKPGAFGFMADGGVDASLHKEWRFSGDGNGGTVGSLKNPFLPEVREFIKDTRPKTNTFFTN